MMGDTGGEGVYRVSWEQDTVDSGVWVATRGDSYSYIAMVEEVSKAGGRVGTHLNAVAPGKWSVLKVGQCSLCRSLNLTFEAFCGEYLSCSRAVAILATTNRKLGQDVQQTKSPYFA